MTSQKDGRRGWSELVLLLSSLSLLGVVWCALETFSTVFFYWPFLKLIGYGTIFFLLVGLSRRKDAGHPSNVALGIEMAVAMLILIIAQSISLRSFPHPLFAPPRLDIATTVEVAIKTLFTLHENPYNPSDPQRWTPFVGVAYPYGPMMLFGYLPSLWNESWFKFCSVVYLCGILGLSARFATKEADGILPKMAAAVFVVAIIMIPRAILNDVSEGINDHFPVFLVLVSLTFVGLHKQGWAGVFAGLSLGAKFSPAALLILLFVRRKPPIRFFVGVAIGCLPTLPFLVWEPTRFFHDVVQFHFIKSGTPTSILTITPPELHDLFRALRYVCVAVFVARNFHKEIEVKAVMFEFTLLVILINSLHVEMHSNHMFWMLPTSAILLTQYRFRLSSLARSALGR